MHLLLWAEDSETELRSELAELFPGKTVPLSGHPLLEADSRIIPGTRLPHLAFARQLVPDARAITAESIRAWANLLVEAILAALADNHPWALHIEPIYGARTSHRIGARAWHSARRARKLREVAPVEISARPPSEDVDPEAGRRRCLLIREALVEMLRKKRRHLLRHLRQAAVPFTEEDSLVQLLLTGPEAGYISVAAAPLPFEQRHLISPFPKGEVPLASDKTAPSRAFAKLIEAELRLGRSIGKGETCVDLGASPGSWTSSAANRGAQVIAVDHSPLREDLMQNRLVRFERGDAFGFRPQRAVDWLLCDVLAAPERTAELLLDWLRRGWCRHFVATLKLKDAPRNDTLAMLKRELPPLTSELFLMRLCANKKEICAFGIARCGASEKPG